MISVENLSKLRNESLESVRKASNIKVDTLAGRRVPKGITVPEMGLRRGAYVVSVEGEEYEVGNQVVEGRAFLGRLIGVERTFGGYLLYFSHGNEGWDEIGERRGRPRHTLHPLCVDGGFFVPEDGIKVLDAGNLILVSKYGIFGASGYSELADQYRQRYMQVYQAYVDLKNEYEQKIGQLNALMHENETLKASREHWLWMAGEITQRYQMLYDMYVKFRSEYEGVVAMLDKMEDVDSSLKETIKYELSMVDKRITDMLQLFEHFKIDESMRSKLIGVPKITDDMRNYYKNKILKKTGMGTMTELDNELENKEKEVEQLKQQLQQYTQYIQQLQARNKQLENYIKQKAQATQRNEVIRNEVEEENEGEEETEEGEGEEGENEEGEGNPVSRILSRRP